MGFFSLDSSLQELSAHCQRFSRSLYRFRDISPKIVIFILSSISTNFFFNIFVLMSTKRKCQQIWAIGSLFEMKRGQRGRKRYFYSMCRFLFNIRFWWDFFIGFLFTRAFSRVSTVLTWLVPFPRYKGSNVAIAQNHNFFISSPISKNFFLNIFCFDAYKKNMTRAFRNMSPDLR